MPRYDDGLFSPPAPIAKVILRAPGTTMSLGDVPMLIDSGADVTLLPQASVAAPGIELNMDEVYRLEGFNGSVSTSSAVDAELIFCRRTFKGRFLLIDQAWGILGRDVLNHIPIILDGPRLLWHER